MKGEIYIKELRAATRENKTVKLTKKSSINQSRAASTGIHRSNRIKNQTLIRDDKNAV